jgi:hypothetical protein
MRKSYDFSNAIQGAHHKQYAQGHSVRIVKDSGTRADSLAVRKKDSQLTELGGKHLLISRLIAAGYEVAEPLRDKGIDLLMYCSGENGSKFAALPIQLKASSHESFSLDRKYERFPRLLIAYVWNVHTPASSDVYALTFDEALQILKKKGHADRDAWTKGGKWYVRDAGVELKIMLKPYRMTTELLQRKLQKI